MEERKCKGCDRNVMVTEQGVFHVNGGSMVQDCKNCGWTGSQIGGFEKCPRCGDGTQMLNNHMAS